MSVLVEHIAAMRNRYIAEHGKAPGTLVIGRWDARELARAVAPQFRTNAHGAEPMRPLRPREFLRHARTGFLAAGAQVKVDGRIGRMPGALFWH